MARDPFIETVLQGKVPGMSADPDNPALAYKDMDIRSAAGTRVRFTGYGGYDSDQEHARRYLEVGSVYTIVDTDVGDWRTVVTLHEVPGQRFNSVMFEEDVVGAN